MERAMREKPLATLDEILERYNIRFDDSANNIDYIEVMDDDGNIKKLS